MGLTYLKIEVGNPGDPDVAKELEFLVDSGAVYAVVPTPVLEAFGIKPAAEEEYRLPDGRFITRKKDGAAFKYKGKVGFADVIFGEEGDLSLIHISEPTRPY